MWISPRCKGNHSEELLRLGRFFHKTCYRNRLDDGSLPGTPDPVLPRSCTVILVHDYSGIACQKPPCRDSEANVEFWQRKFASNVEGDCLTVKNLLAASWKVLVIWECGLKSVGAEKRLEWLPGHIADGLEQYLECLVSEWFSLGSEMGQRSITFLRPNFATDVRPPADQ